MARTLTDDQARQLIKDKKTFQDMVRMRWPEMTDEECNFVLWELTPFPMVQDVQELADAISELPEPEDFHTLQVEDEG